MGLFNKNNKKGGLMDEIRCDEDSYLIWKWRPSGYRIGENQRENSIRWGSSLRVKAGEVAVFVYKQKNEIMYDFIEGPFDQIVKTYNLPILADIIGLAYEGGTPFQAEVYFINSARIIQAKFGVPYFEVYDPRFLDFAVPVAVRGTITFSITDYREFIKLHQLSEFNLNDFLNQVRDVVNRFVKSAVANIPSKCAIPVVQIENKILEINDIVEPELIEHLKKKYGINVSGIDIGSIEIDKFSTEYRQLLSVTKDLTSSITKAETKAKIQDIADKQQIEMDNYRESLRIQRELNQYAQQMHIRSENMSAYHIEKQSEVGIAGANALGKMGSNSMTGGHNGGDGFNMAAFMASMAIGGTVGQNIANTMNNVMSGINNPSSMTGTTPPPIQVTAYYVSVNGQPIGPFDISVLKQMIKEKQIFTDSLIWKQGMLQWTKAEMVDEINDLFLKFKQEEFM